MKFIRNFTALFLISLQSTLHAEPGTADWPQWRGPTRNGHIASDTWPDRLSKENLTELWRVELGPSYSGPIAYGNRIFVTETKDRETEIVRALDRSTGKELWKQGWAGAIKVPFFARANGSWIRSTPACDGERLYVAGIRDELVCLDATSGKQLWRLNFVDTYKTPPPSFGFVCSPLIVDEHIYVQAGGGFVKVEKESGKIVWRSLVDGGGMFSSAFSSPVLASLNGKTQLVVQTRERLAGVDPEDGAELWSRKIEAFRGMNILTPVVYREQLFTSAHSGRSQLFSLTRNENDFEIQQVWDNKAMAYMSSPVVIEDHLYLHLKNQRFTCIDLKTGDTKWTTKPYGKYWSMVVAGNRILALDEKGELLLIEASPDAFKLIDRLQISRDSTWAHLAVSDDLIFVRELKAQVASTSAAVMSISSV